MIYRKTKKDECYQYPTLYGISSIQENENASSFLMGLKTSINYQQGGYKECIAPFSHRYSSSGGIGIRSGAFINELSHISCSASTSFTYLSQNSGTCHRCAFQVADIFCKRIAYLYERMSTASSLPTKQEQTYT